MKKSEVTKRLGRRVSAARQSRGLTQEQLAERSGFTSKFISEVERGLTNVPIVTLAKLGNALGTTVSELTVGIDGQLPNAARESAAIYAGRSKAQQAAIGRLLLAVDDLIKESKSDA